jgi:hypothetical protein
MMPAHFGYLRRGRGPAPKYHDVTTMTLSFLSDRKVLSQYLPDIINALADLPVNEIRVSRVSKAGTALETETRTVRAMY